MACGNANWSAAGVVLILIIALVLILINLQGAPFLERRECAPR